MAFIEGFIGGFEVSNRIRDRARVRDIQERSLNLADAASARAEGASVRQQQTFDTARERQNTLDRSNELLAKRNRGEEFTPEEQEEFEAGAAINPTIQAIFQRDSDLNRDTKAGLIFQDSMRTGLGAIAESPTGVRAPDGPQPAPGPDQDLTQLQSVLEPGSPGAPEQNIQGVPEAPSRSGVRNVTKGEIEEITGMTEDEVDALGLTRNATFAGIPVPLFEIPDNFYTKDDIDGADIGEATRMRTSNRERAGDLSHQVSLAQSAEGMDEITAESMAAAMDMDDPVGEGFRQLIANQPQVAINAVTRDFAAVERADPNGAAILATKLAPIAEQQIVLNTTAMQNVPLTSEGLVDRKNPDYVTAKRNLDSSLFILEQAHGIGVESILAGIRGESMPVNMATLNESIIEQVANLPRAGHPASRSEFQANRTIGTRAIADAQSGRSRTFTVKQVEAMIWLRHRDLLSEEGFEEALNGTAFSNATDFEFMNWDPTKPLVRTDSNGNAVVVMTPLHGSDATQATKDRFSAQHQAVVTAAFSGLLDNDAGIVERARMKELEQGFYAVLQNNAQEIFNATGGEMDVRQLSNLTEGQMNTLLLRYQQMLTIQTAWDESWRSMWPFGKDSAEQFGTNFFSSLGLRETADKLELPLQQLPRGMDVDVDGARAWMVQQTNDRGLMVMGQAGTDLGVANTVQEFARNQQLPPQ